MGLPHHSGKILGPVLTRRNNKLVHTGGKLRQITDCGWRIMAGGTGIAHIGISVRLFLQNLNSPGGGMLRPGSKPVQPAHFFNQGQSNRQIAMDRYNYFYIFPQEAQANAHAWAGLKIRYNFF
jgi:hypothetical protein